MWLRLAVGLAVFQGLAYAAPGKHTPDTLRAPAHEGHDRTRPQVALPAVPSFELPPGEPGFVDPKTLRVRGKKLLDTDLRVKGYITWIYDCIADNAKPGMSRAQIQKMIDADPTLCERPKFYLGSRRDTPPDRALWVVDVPRPPNKLEKERLPKEDLAAWPAVPKLKVGDHVVVTGRFALSSPHNERNSDGLVVFSAIEPAKLPSTAPASVAIDPPTSVSPPPHAPARTKRPIHKAIDDKIYNMTMLKLSHGNEAAGRKQFAEAVTHYQRAVAVWDGNHLAWYGLGGALAQQRDWKLAADAFARAVALRPDAAMYQLWAGVSSYEATTEVARRDLAAKEGRAPEQVQVDRSSLVFDTARTYLEAAIALDANLWRAHYFIGRIHRDGDRVREAAESFSRAIRADPTQQAPFIALTELYRKWDYTRQAIEVAEVGVKHVTADASDVFYVLGMAHEDNKAHAKAVPAFTRALELKPDNYKAMFQRGQALFALGKVKQAKKDLEVFVANGPPSLSFARQVAQKILADIAAGKKKR